MKKILLVFCLLFSTIKIFAQQFSQYNTATLYDSFENPSQKAFTTDTSKQFAFNFFVPNFNANFYITGDAQATLKSRAFNNIYSNGALAINKGKLNHLNVSGNAYIVMFKMFSSIHGDAELGFSAQTKVEGRGLFTDESVALVDGSGKFESTTYDNLFNNNFYFQSYDQLSLTYKERITKQFTIGFKLSALSGVQYNKLDISRSQVTFDKTGDSAVVALGGTYKSGYIPGHISTRDFLPTFRNPGAAISIGTSYLTEDGFLIQANVKDLGFIHWGSSSQTYNFNGVASARGLSTTSREDSVYNAVYKNIHSSGTLGAFNTPINGRAELSVNENFYLDDEKKFKYSPTLIASKELFYTGFTGALVNPFQYKKFVFTLTTSYDDLKLLNIGTQFMLKSANFEVYLGSDRIAQTVGLTASQLSRNSGQTFSNSSYTGADVFLGFSLKFGPLIEHDMNASSIPTGEKGFLGRLFGRLFKTND